MAKKKSPQISLPRIDISAFFYRFHTVTFTVIAGGCLVVAVYLLSNILTNASTPDDYAPPSTDTSFDTETIEKVEKLRPLTNSPVAPELPSGRTSPFTQ